MGVPFKPLRVKLIIGLISLDTALFEKAEKILNRKFGKIDEISPHWDFKQTNYYEKEMGKNLKRVFLSFEKLIEANQLINIKHFTNKLELKLAKNNKKRNINIDPGYITLSKLILATTKNFSHRIYVGDGIFEEITLFFRDNSFCFGALTYPDYRQQSYIDFFNKIRKNYYIQLQNRYGLSQLYRCA